MVGKLNKLKHLFQVDGRIAKVDLKNTNVTEGFKHQLVKVTKFKSVFPTDGINFKILYLAMTDINKK